MSCGKCSGAESNKDTGLHRKHAQVDEDLAIAVNTEPSFYTCIMSSHVEAILSLTTAA